MTLILTNKVSYVSSLYTVSSHTRFQMGCAVECIFIFVNRTFKRLELF